MAFSLRTIRIGPLFGALFVTLMLMGAAFKIPVIDGLIDLGRVPHAESMSAAKWYGPAVDDVLDEIGGAGRVASVSVYDRSLSFEVDDDGHIDMWGFHWNSPRHMKATPSVKVPTGRTFSASLLDPAAPARIMAAARRRYGDVSISVLRLEPAKGGLGATWTLNGLSDRGAVTLTAYANGRLLTTGS